MIRLLCLIPSAVDATAYYRASMPIAKLIAEAPDISPMFVGEYSWATVSLADIVFMQRPFNDQHSTVVDIVKSCGKPLWVDYDDDLFCVPDDNPTHSMYSEDKVRKNIVKILSSADVITVSTQAIADRIKEIEKVAERKFDVRVIPNSVDLDFISRIKKEPLKDRHRLVFWRGSNTHQKDLLQHAYQIIEAAKKNRDFTFNFLGYHPWFITGHMESSQSVVAQGLDIMLYHDYLQQIQPPVMIVPLVDCEFNRAKSNIAWLEGSCAGAMVIAPDFPEWRHDGVINYTSAEDFGKKLNTALSGGYDLNDLVSKSRKVIVEKFSLQKNNQKRTELIYEFARKNKTSCQNPWSD